MENIFAENLKACRMENKISQVQLAKELGVSQACVSGWEHGKTEPTLTYLWLLADIF